MQFPSTIPTLHTDGITLSPVSINDVDMIFQLVTKNRMHLRTWLNWVDSNTTVDQTSAFVQNRLQSHEKHTGITYTIWTNNVMIGIISFSRIDEINRIARIGYWIDEEYQGKGYTTHACRELIKLGFDILSLHRIEIAVARENEKSAAIPKRLGFTHEATLTDAEWINDHFTDLELYVLLNK
jgi:ribosomal-protein-serine acetyltransferase